MDFTNLPRRNKTYAGANGSKICVELNGELYMLKFPSLPHRNKDMSYTNGCLSEYIGSHIFEIVGIPVQETLLGTYSVNGKEKIVVACKDFTTADLVLQDFASLKNTIIDSEHNGYGTELDDILTAIETQTAMREISVLEKHIINYAKTRETYAEYRKAGYSKAFRAEHEHEIRLCQEAKEYFRGLGLEKLPTMKMLKAEYVELLEKKNALYPEYKKAREQSKELLSAKANLELFFGYGDMAKETKQRLNDPSK